MRSLTWRKALYAAFFVFFALAIVFWILTLAGWLITEPVFEPLNVLVGAAVSSMAAVLALLKARTAEDTPITEYRPTLTQAERNRQADAERQAAAEAEREARILGQGEDPGVTRFRGVLAEIDRPTEEVEELVNAMPEDPGVARFRGLDLD